MSPWYQVVYWNWMNPDDEFDERQVYEVLLTVQRESAVTKTLQKLRADNPAKFEATIVKAYAVDPRNDAALRFYDGDPELSSEPASDWLARRG